MAFNEVPSGAVHRGQSRPHLRWRGRGRFGTDFIGRSFFLFSSSSFVMISLSLLYYVVGRSGLAVFIRQFLIFFSRPSSNAIILLPDSFVLNSIQNVAIIANQIASYGPTNPMLFYLLPPSIIIIPKYLLRLFSFPSLILAPVRPARLVH